MRATYEIDYIDAAPRRRRGGRRVLRPAAPGGGGPGRAHGGHRGTGHILLDGRLISPELTRSCLNTSFLRVHGCL